MSYSNKIQNLEESTTLAITQLAASLKAQGKDVISFSAGEPDFDTPKIIKDEAVRALNIGFTKYTTTQGIEDLRKAISYKLKRDNNLNYNANDIIVSNGAKQSIFNVFQAILNDGDEVLIPTPCWVTYPDVVKYSGGKPIFVPTKEEFEFKPSKRDLERSATNRTKAIVITSPSNPTGMVFDKSELEAVIEVASKHNLWVISDEIYEKLSYDKQAISIGSIVDPDSDVFKKIITINGLSKSVAMTGWRMGYLACKDNQLIKYINNLQSQTTSNINSITQKASITALSEDANSDIEYMKEEFKVRRDTACEIIKDIAGISVVKPHGAFYLFINIGGVRDYNGDSMKFCKDLLEHQGVALVPGSAFYMDGFVRMSFACDMDTIKEGLKRIKDFVTTR